MFINLLHLNILLKSSDMRFAARAATRRCSALKAELVLSRIFKSKRLNIHYKAVT